MAAARRSPVSGRVLYSVLTYLPLTSNCWIPNWSLTYSVPSFASASGTGRRSAVASPVAPITLAPGKGVAVGTLDVARGGKVGRGGAGTGFWPGWAGALPGPGGSTWIATVGWPAGT